MPLYEYECESCGHRFEVIQRFSDAPPDRCPKCGGAVRKLQSAPAFQFKGTGWYITDYARKEQAPGSKGDDAPAGKSEDGKGGEGKSSESKKGEGTAGEGKSGEGKNRDSKSDAGKSAPQADAPAREKSPSADKPPSSSGSGGSGSAPDKKAS